MAAEATPLYDGACHRLTASSALSAGEIGQLADSRAAFVAGLQAIAANDSYEFCHKRIVAVACASGTTFSKGDPVIWDASANLAVAPGLTVDGSADFYLGVAHKAKVSGQTLVEVDLNAHPLLPGIPKPFVFEFDTEDGEDESGSVKVIHELIPANQNKYGWLVLGVYGIVSEQFGGASQDQGIVTITDGDGTSICTLTPSDSGADAVGDVIVGTGKVLGGTTGDAVKTVAAGKSIRGQVTQETSGSGKAGKMKVYVLVMPLV